DGSADFGTITIGGSGSNTGSPFVVTVGSNVYDGHNVNFNLALNSSSGAIANKTFSAVVGTVTSFNPLGPDNYGYYMYDNTDASYAPAPFYNWAEISPFEGGSGTRISFPFSTDDDAVVISLPFTLRYYGQNFNYTLVSINGFIAFDTARYDMQGHHWPSFDNNQIPEPSAPDGIIAPFWDDLEYAGNNGVFKYYDTTNHRFIIEWKNCTHPNAPGNHPETFQLIILDPAYYPTPTGDCELIYQYHTVYNDDTDTWHPESPGLYCTVGLQNLQNNDGLLYTYDNIYNAAAAPLVAGRAIKVTTATGIAPPPELSYDPAAFVKHVQTGESVQDTLQISNTGQGILAFNLHLTADNRLAPNPKRGLPEHNQSQPIGYVTTPGSKPLEVNQPIYPPVILNQGGPDIYGNHWIDSDEQGGPVYNWIDISGVGTQVFITSDDGYEGPIDIGMNFPYYENTYSSLYINGNGSLTFDGGFQEWENTDIPNTAAPNNLLSMLWDDLSPQIAGSIYYYYDSANSRFIVSFINTPFYSGGGDLTFQAIIYSTGRIVFQYGNLDPGTRGLNQCTVGIENPDGTDGLQVAYNSDYLHNSLALLFIPPVHWMSCNISSGALLPGTSMPAILNFTAAELTEGIYTGHITIDSNDPDEPVTTLPVTFTVSSGPIQDPDIQLSVTSFTESIPEGSVKYDTVYISNAGTAQLNYVFGDDRSWITVLPVSGDVPVALRDTIVVTLDATGLPADDYAGNISISSNDPDQPAINLPVTLTVTGIGGCHYVVGDANGSNTFTGLDVTYSVRYFKGGNAPVYSCECTPGHAWYVAGDVNGSCTFSGLDVTYMVRYFKGGAAPIPCADCPPSGLLAPFAPKDKPTPSIQPILN
ncbi:MAG TPA: hypothetical protein DEO84_12095, partial [candidate division Zixibacteria bacterium]|nr:hypothetical protein [candidate division Zixibacteria bacterium]HBZ02049.1 hypothetical protein [candidate division Zixibacteria bacterium]